jgi:citrate lyase beta subunit
MLVREVKNDLSCGLFGKTAIHPRQVPLIEEQYRITPSELQMAEHLLDESAPAVFRLCESMCEPATHRRWAALVLERARLYGMVSDASQKRSFRDASAKRR